MKDRRSKSRANFKLRACGSPHIARTFGYQTRRTIESARNNFHAPGIRFLPKSARLKQQRAIDYYEERASFHHPSVKVHMKPSDFGFWILDLRLQRLNETPVKIRNPKSKFRNPKSEIRNPNSVNELPPPERDRVLQYRALRAALSRTNRPSTA